MGDTVCVVFAHRDHLYLFVYRSQSVGQLDGFLHQIVHVLYSLRARTIVNECVDQYHYHSAVWPLCVATLLGSVTAIGIYNLEGAFKESNRLCEQHSPS